LENKGLKKKCECITCGHKLVQKFIGLKHCKRCVSWKKDIGYFERNGDMVFALERQLVGKRQTSDFYTMTEITMIDLILGGHGVIIRRMV